MGKRTVLVGMLAVVFTGSFGSARAGEGGRWWNAAVEKRLGEAGDNEGPLRKALREVPREQRVGLAFLIEHMPDRDSKTLGARFLLENVDLAYRARRAVPWGKDIPEEIFLNEVLPYANVDEKREAWRREFFDMCLPMVKGCKTAGEAAQKLNTEFFGKVKVRYSTKRKAANQSPRESIDLGLASCTGLSILLSDACRSVCVPARLVGTPLWSNGRGNHTWVEIWDGAWHFTGACEQDPRGLNRGWFVGEASRAKKDSFLHAVYAVSFRRTGQHFPLVWAMRDRSVAGVNVTDRYARKEGVEAGPGVDGERSAEALQALRAALEGGKSLGEIVKQGFAAVPLTLGNAEAARDLLWKAHAEAVRRERSREIQERVLREKGEEMRFDMKMFGKKPAGGWSLWLSLHGGGGAPKRINDGQWENQKRLYSLEEGIYLSPRAPTDTWNMWHQGSIDRFFARLIEGLVVVEGVDPDRVYLMGYSAGGDGVYQMAPRMADRWAAAAMMAGHPNGVSLLSLRNVPFALQVGAKDAAYHRNKVGREYGERLAELRKKDPGGYEHFVKIHEGRGHWMNGEDRAALPWMAKFRRDPVPARVVWKQTGTVHDRSYWLAVPKGKGKIGSLVAAERKGQRVEITAVEDVGRLVVRLDDRMVDMDRPVEVVFGGKKLFQGRVARRIGVLARSLLERGDPRLMFAGEVEVEIPSGAATENGPGVKR